MSEAKCEPGWGDLSTRALLDAERPSPHPAASRRPTSELCSSRTPPGEGKSNHPPPLFSFARIYAPLSILP